MTQASRHIHINGIVQGVGFRPFIYNLAQDFCLSGWVRNSASGVDIEISGLSENLASFLETIPKSAPPLAQIDSIEIVAINNHHNNGFKILQSENNPIDFIPVSPDMAICKDCRHELFDPNDRRFRYPFINCTNCGPRFSIIKDVPYDRPATTMANFEMCAFCLDEYQDPTNRRFHAQPVACPKCGPQVWLENSQGKRLSEKVSAIEDARQMLADGKIVAIKGLGGFHLACNAANLQTVTELRKRKKRPDKPFAVMAFDLQTIRHHAIVPLAAEKMLTSPQAPIVILPANPQTTVVDQVAPGQSTIGFMLPYTPLHLLILEPHISYPEVLVMTSGNLSEEPIIHENQPARETLSGIADAFLMHDRPIHKRVDDSVFTIIEDEPYPIRYARGYAPNPIRLTESLPSVLAVGPQMKNTFCITREKYAFNSHYIGEMDNWETYRDFCEAVHHFESLFRIAPQAIGYDLHPDYLTTRYAHERAANDGVTHYGIQHHHAHLAACIVENSLPLDEDIGGIIFDGTGYGTDGTIWGGEFIIGNCLDFHRLYHLKPVPLPGGDISIQKPARMALSTLYAYDIEWNEALHPYQALPENERLILKNQLEKGLNITLTSSMGRLFDTVSALLGIRNNITYEAQAAIEMEAVSIPGENEYYPWKMDDNLINIKPMLERILADLRAGLPIGMIAARFHNTIAQLSLEIALLIQRECQINRYVFSGGVWQNKFLLEKTLNLFREYGLEPVIHRKLPANDGCVALGQAIISAYKYSKDKE